MENTYEFIFREFPRSGKKYSVDVYLQEVSRAPRIQTKIKDEEKNENLSRAHQDKGSCESNCSSYNFQRHLGLQSVKRHCASRVGCPGNSDYSVCGHGQFPQCFH